MDKLIEIIDQEMRKRKTRRIGNKTYEVGYPNLKRVYSAVDELQKEVKQGYLFDAGDNGSKLLYYASDEFKERLEKIAQECNNEISAKLKALAFAARNHLPREFREIKKCVLELNELTGDNNSHMIGRQEDVYNNSRPTMQSGLFESGDLYRADRG